MFNNTIGIDLGTATVLVYAKGKGIILNEPSVVAVNTKTNEICAVGREAQVMLGRTPETIKAVRPLQDGVISSYTLTEAMIKAFLTKIRRHTVGNPRIMMCVPSGITDVEQRAVIETARQMGSKEIYLIEEPVAAALGAAIDISRPHGTMVVDMGGGTTDVAVISLGKIVVSRSLKIAGDEFNEAVVRFMRKEYNLVIGPQTAEHIKKTIGGVYPRSRDISSVARGISTVSGLPTAIVVSAEELRSAFEDLTHNIVERIREVLEETPPQLQSDILQDGILLTGGGALLYGLDKRISEAVGVKAYLADDIIACVAKGAGIALSNLDGVADPTKRFYKQAYIH